MNKELTKIRENALTRIKNIMGKYSEDGELYISDFSEGESPIVRENPYNDEFTYTLDKVEMTEAGIGVHELSFDASSSWDNITLEASELDTDTLVGIAEWLEEHEEEIAEFAYGE